MKCQKAKYDMAEADVCAGNADCITVQKARHCRRKVVVSPDYEHLTAFLERIPEMFDEGCGDVLYAGRNEVRRFDAGGTRLVAKRYKRVNTVQRIVYSFFRRTKAERAYVFAELLRQRGVDTPREVAYIEVSRNGLFETGYFVSIECPYPPAFDRLVPPKEFDRRMAEDLAAFINTMHSRGILHGDMNFGNFLYHYDAGGDCHFTVIDTNRSHFRRGYPSRKECLYNFRTTTHRRDVFDYILRVYARLRGWDEAETVEEATRYLEDFEQYHHRKERIKKLKS